MIEKRIALIIANNQYNDPELRQLIAPASDAEALARVLENPKIGNFQVKMMMNEPKYKIEEEIEALFTESERLDFVLLYFSCHGIKDKDGQLYLAPTNTKHNLLKATAVSAKLVNDIMVDCRSRRQVLILDCCYSGAFARGMVVKGDMSIGVKECFEGGHGRVILTSSDARQYSFEGDEIKGKGVGSIFTSAMVHGLETGEADIDSDGRISIDDLFEYVEKRVAAVRPEQKPKKWCLDMDGDIFITPKQHQIPNQIQHGNESAERIIHGKQKVEMEHIEKNCTKCGKTTRTGLKFCTQCGAALSDGELAIVEKICPNCDHKNTLRSECCTQCGASLIRNK